MPLSSLQSILGKKFQKSGIAQSVTAALVCEYSEELMRKQFGGLSQQIIIVSFMDQTLNLKTTSSVLSQEIKLCEQEIKERINSKLGRNLVKKFRFLA